MVSRERGRWKQSSLTWEEKSWQGSSSRFAFHSIVSPYVIWYPSIPRIPCSSPLSELCTAFADSNTLQALTASEGDVLLTYSNGQQFQL